VRQVRLPEVWKIQLTEPNVLVLDWPRWRVGGGQWRGAAEILCIDGQLRREMGISRRGGGWAVMMQPWAQPAEANPKTAALELSHTFDVKHLPSGPLDLVFENPEHFRIFLNGVEVDKEDDAGWWVDKSQRRLPLPAGALKVGTNCLTVLCPRFHNLVNLEAAFILGNFGVKVNGLRTTIVNPPAELRTGNWVRQSLPFYSAAVVYHAKVKAHMSRGERAILSLPDWKGTCVIVRAGGQPLGTLGWPPYEIDITDAFAEAGSGGVDLGIEVVSSRRNAFGPLHRAPDSSDEMVGSSRFRVQGKPWPKDYDLVPCGLIKKPILRIVS
jgi:hypothetical protein